jgi:hypothetical protein
MYVLKVDDVGMHPCENLPEFLPRLLRIDSTGKHPKFGLEVFVSVYLSKIDVAHKKIIIQISQVSLILHSKKSHFMSMAAQQLRKVESVGAIATTVVVPSINEKYIQILCNPLIHLLQDPR